MCVSVPRGDNKRKEAESRRRRDENGVVIEKQCNVCFEWLGLEDFSHDAATADKRRGMCRECDNAQFARWANEDPVRVLLGGAAKRVGIRGSLNRGKFIGSLKNVVEEQQKQPCPICHKPLEWTISKAGGPRGANPMAISVDQIIPGAGYTPENIQLLHFRCNVRKNDHTLESARQLHQYFVNIESKKNRGKTQHHEWRQQFSHA